MAELETKSARGVRKDRAGGIVPAGKYTKLPDIQVRERKISMVDWLHREFKAGNYLAEYLRREKATGLARRRKIASRMQAFQQNKKSDLRLRCVLPARKFMRLRLMDKDFFEDESNVRNLIRDNPEIAPWKGR